MKKQVIETIAAYDFKILGDLEKKGGLLAVAFKLKEWEGRPFADKIAPILYEMWCDRFNTSHQYKWREFENSVKDVFVQNGCQVRRIPIADFHVSLGSVSMVVECKRNAGENGKVYEGIAQLLFYRWSCKDNKSQLLLALDQAPTNSDLIDFARSLGIRVWFPRGSKIEET